MIRIESVTVAPLDLGLREPFEIALGVQETATNLLVRVETETGVVGLGEGSPLPPVTGETQASAIAIARAAANSLEGRDLTKYRSIIEELRTSVPGNTAALFALETALLDAYCRERELPLSALFGGPPTELRTDFTIPIVEADVAAERAMAMSARGFTEFKVKCGDAVEASIERVAAVSEAVPEATLSVDANQGWTPAETRRFATVLDDHGIELTLLEQPVHRTDIESLATLRTAIDTPIVADESVFTPADAMRVCRAGAGGAADVINIKLGKAGLLGTAAIASIATAANVGLMVGCMLESAIGIHTSTHVVSGLGGFDHIDLDGNQLLAEDVIDDSDDGPRIAIDGPGHGIDPDEVFPT
jgi:L-alanine-DL-glutamate epimerase-like enolase superfamily enzyme